MISDTLCRTMRRSAPAMLTPAVRASFTAHSRPYSRKATKSESSVRMVRVFFRFRLLQTRAKYFIGDGGERSFHGLIAEFAFVQVQGARRPSRSVRVVRHHDDRLPMLFVQRLEQIED